MMLLHFSPSTWTIFETARGEVVDGILLNHRVVRREEGNAFRTAELERLLGRLGAHGHVDARELLQLLEQREASLLAPHVALRAHAEDQVINQALVQAAHRVLEVRHDVLHDQFPVGVRADLLVRHVVAVDGVDHALGPHVHHLVLDVDVRAGRHDADDPARPHRVDVPLSCRASPPPTPRRPSVPYQQLRSRCSSRTFPPRPVFADPESRARAIF